MATKIFVNLPVKDLKRSMAFYEAVGMRNNPQFTDENATRMIISEDTSAMLVVEPFFEGFVAPRDIADTSESQEVIVGLSAESKEQVDDLTDKALAAGAESLGDADDQGFMYMRGFRDLDGHQWSFISIESER